MSTGKLFAGLAAVGFVAAIGLSLVGAANKANMFEQKLQAQKETNEVKLGQYGQKVAETAQVTDMARDDISKIARDAISGRYGKDGSKAVFQAINENNPSVDPQLYRQIQQVVESGRNEFQNGQETMIDTKRQYKTVLGSVWTGTLMSIVGYPKIDLEQFKAVTTDRAQDAFRGGKESSPIQLRPQPAK